MHYLYFTYGLFSLCLTILDRVAAACAIDVVIKFNSLVCSNAHLINRGFIAQPEVEVEPMNQNIITSLIAKGA